MPCFPQLPVDNMVSKELEFRGIRREHLEEYFEELGAEKVTDFTFKSENWSGQILSEEEITFTTVFKVNAVKIRFQASNTATLDNLIKNYRYKTTRIGG